MLKGLERHLYGIQASMLIYILTTTKSVSVFVIFQFRTFEINYHYILLHLDPQVFV